MNVLSVVFDSVEKEDYVAICRWYMRISYSCVPSKVVLIQDTNAPR